MIETAPHALKVCSRCVRTLPVERFRLRADRPGHRRGECRDCWRKYIRQYRAGRRDMLLHDFCRRAANAKNDRQAVGLGNRFARRFGSKRFAGLLVDYAYDLADRRPGSAGVLTALRAIYRTCLPRPAG
jgi:hypothetical protein